MEAERARAEERLQQLQRQEGGDMTDTVGDRRLSPSTFGGRSHHTAPAHRQSTEAAGRSR